VAIITSALLAIIALLLLPPHAHGNFVYWADGAPGSSIGRAKLNGTGVNNGFIGGLNDPSSVAIDSKYIYWTQGSAGTSSIGRANLDGSGANPSFIPNSAGLDFLSGASGIAVTGNNIYWVNSGTNPDTIGRANLDSTGPNPTFLAPASLSACGLAADQSFLYWIQGLGSVGRAPLDGSSSDLNFITGANSTCGIAVDPSFLYWPTGGPKNIARAPVGGGTPTLDFIPAAAADPNDPIGVAVNPQYVFWGSEGPTDFIGRANVNGGSPNPTLITSGATSPGLMAAAPSNKITVNSIKKKKSKGTATINAKVPGPGQITLNQTSTPPDLNATASGVKQVGLTISQASSFNLAVKPVGKTAKKLNKQIKKQLRKKRKAKATAKVTTYIHFVPAGVAGVPNTLQVKVTLVKQRKKK
jgi:hypothetical protein